MLIYSWVDNSENQHVSLKALTEAKLVQISNRQYQ